MTIRTRAISAVLVAGACATASCGGEDDSGGGNDFESTIDRIPASALEGVGDSSPELYYSDMAIRWDELELADATPEERSTQPIDRQYLARFPLVPLMIEPVLQSQLDESRTEVGFTAFDIEREATVVQLPRSLSVAEVRVDAETIDAAVRSDPAWSDDLDEVEYEDRSYYSWGDDGAAMDFKRSGPFHGRLGRGGQLGVDEAGDDHTVAVRALSTEEMEAALDAAAGDEASALDEGPLVPLLDAMVDGEVIQAYVLFEPLVLDPAGTNLTPEQLEEMMVEMTLVGPYRSIMAVELVGDEDDDTSTEILLDFGDEEDAADNVGVIEEILADGTSARTAQPWSELLPDASVGQRDDAVAVTVPGGGHFKVAFDAMISRDLFLAGG